MSRIWLMFINYLIILIGCSSIPVYRQLNNDEISKKQFCVVKYKFFYPTEDSTAVEYANKTYYLCCDKCEEIFSQNISKFIKEETDNSKNYYRGGSCH